MVLFSLQPFFEKLAAETSEEMNPDLMPGMQQTVTEAESKKSVVKAPAPVTPSSTDSAQSAESSLPTQQHLGVNNTRKCAESTVYVEKAVSAGVSQTTPQHSAVCQAAYSEPVEQAKTQAATAAVSQAKAAAVSQTKAQTSPAPVSQAQTAGTPVAGNLAQQTSVIKTLDLNTHYEVSL